MISDSAAESSSSHYEHASAMATGLLLCLAGLLVAALIWEPWYPSLSWLRAFAEAAMVGGLADWYAVTVLFRRPLGLPIPHTEIIRETRRDRDQACSLTQRQLLTPDAVGKLIASWRIPEECMAVLLDPARRLLLTQEAARLLAHGRSV